MSILQRIDQDLKTALLSGQKDTVMTLRGLKSVLLNEAIAKGVKDTGLSDEDTVKVISREVKKLGESAELYSQANAKDRAERELAEQAILHRYLPRQLDDTELSKLIDETIASHGAEDSRARGQIIGAVKAKAGSRADGARIAALVKERLSS